MAADAAIFIGWNRPAPGMDRASMELLNSVTAFLDRSKERGQCESYEIVILGAHGGDLNGFILVRGQRLALEAMINTDEFLDLGAQMGHQIVGLGIIRAYVGDGVKRQLERFKRLLK